MFNRSILPALVFCVLVAQPALARNTGDLFSDNGLEVQPRPPVASDRYRGYTGPNRDLFTHSPQFKASPQFTDKRKDMMRHIERDTKPDYKDMMPPPRLHQSPPDSIYQNPNT